MRRQLAPHVERARIRTGALRSESSDAPNGAFALSLAGHLLHIISDDGATTGWEHVSVSAVNRTPTWEEMHSVKKLFWPSHEVVMQLHPAESEYVNIHEHVLHLWRPKNADIPTPPRALV